MHGHSLSSTNLRAQSQREGQKHDDSRVQDKEADETKGGYAGGVLRINSFSMTYVAPLDKTSDFHLSSLLFKGRRDVSEEIESSALSLQLHEVLCDRAGDGITCVSGLDRKTRGLEVGLVGDDC